MLPRLQAEAQLAAMNAAAYPHMERREARAYARSVQSYLGPQEPPRKATRADLNALGIKTPQTSE